jgi:dihydroorotase
VRRSETLGLARVYPDRGADPGDLAGQRLAEMNGLARAGCIGFSQANQPIDTQLLLRAMQYAATFGYAVAPAAAGSVRWPATASPTMARSPRAWG